MKTNLILAAFAMSFLNACNNSGTASDEKPTVEQNCTSVVVERHGDEGNFGIINIRTDKANEVKLALGEYEEKTETIVSVEYTSDADAEKSQYCTCLMDENGEFIVTSDEIKYE